MTSVDMTSNPNDYERMIDVVLGVHFKQLDVFLEQMLETATDEQRPIIEEFIVHSQIGRIMTTDACLSLASGLHSRWGDAAFGEYKAQQQAKEAAELLAYRLRQHSPNNPEVRRRVLEMTASKCAYCGCGLGADFHIEHVVSKAAGGPDHLANYVPACKSCNSRKSTLHVLEFIKRYGGGA